MKTSLAVGLLMIAFPVSLPAFLVIYIFLIFKEEMNKQ